MGKADFVSGIHFEGIFERA